MSKSLAASQKVMQSYLSELLTDEEDVSSVKEQAVTKTSSQENIQVKVQEKPKEKLKAKVANPAVRPHKEAEQKPLEKLLEGVSKTQELPVQKELTSTKSQHQVKAKVQTPIAKPSIPVVEKATETIQTAKSQGEVTLAADKDYRKGSFQAMFFDVAGLTVAVPLIELGGIHNVDKTTSLMGKPDWFTGVMIHREEKVNVVDTARWVMPEKCTNELLESLNYQYVIMLGTSSWGLSAEQLVDTVTLEQDEVKWLDAPSKRPWLAGLVKERMCALLDVESLIRLLDDGAGIHQN